MGGKRRKSVSLVYCFEEDFPGPSLFLRDDLDDGFHGDSRLSTLGLRMMTESLNKLDTDVSDV